MFETKLYLVPKTSKYSFSQIQTLEVAPCMIPLKRFLSNQTNEPKIHGISNASDTKNFTTVEFTSFNGSYLDQSHMSLSYLPKTICCISQMWKFLPIFCVSNHLFKGLLIFESFLSGPKKCGLTHLSSNPPRLIFPFWWLLHTRLES